MDNSFEELDTFGEAEDWNHHFDLLVVAHFLEFQRFENQELAVFQDYCHYPEAAVLAMHLLILQNDKNRNYESAKLKFIVETHEKVI